MAGRAVSTGVGLAVPTGMVVGTTSGSAVPALAVVAAALVVGSLRVPRFWRVVGRALLAGGAAGLLVLGPGYRLAMRVVAVLDASTEPTFTVAGTAGIVVGVGLVAGAVTTGWSSLVARAWSLPRWGGVLLLTVAVGVPLLGGAEVRREVVELGAGPWVNAPLFVGVTVAFAALADRWARPHLRRPRAPGATTGRGSAGAMLDGSAAGRSS